MRCCFGSHCQPPCSMRSSRQRRGVDQWSFPGFLRGCWHRCRVFSTRRSAVNRGGRERHLAVSQGRNGRPPRCCLCAWPRLFFLYPRFGRPWRQAMGRICEVGDRSFQPIRHYGRCEPPIAARGLHRQGGAFPFASIFPAQVDARRTQEQAR